MDESSGAPSRREVIGGVGTGIAAAAVAGGRAAHAQQPASTPTLAEPQSCVEAYPKPPFPNQKHPFPGLARDM